MGLGRCVAGGFYGLGRVSRGWPRHCPCRYAACVSGLYEREEVGDVAEGAGAEAFLIPGRSPLVVGAFAVCEPVRVAVVSNGPEGLKNGPRKVLGILT